MSAFDYVFGDYSVLRRLLNGGRVDMLDLGDSYTSQDDTSFPKLFPLPFGGATFTVSGTGLGQPPFVDIQSGVGWGTKQAAGVNAVYTPGNSWEIKFNGVAGGGWGNGDRLVDLSFPLLSTGVESLVYSGVDWRLGNPSIETFALLCGTGNDSTKPAIFMRRLDIGLSPTSLANSGSMTPAALGVVSKLSVISTLAGVTTDKSLNLGMALPDAVAPANGSFASVVSLGARLNTVARVFTYHNAGQPGTSLTGVTKWVDPAFMSANALGTLIAAGGYNVVRFHTGLNETGTAAQITTAALSLVATLRAFAPGVMIVFISPAVPDVAYNTILANTDAGFRQAAEAVSGIAYISLYKLYNDTSSPAALNSGGYIAAFHPTATGKLLFRGAEINLYQQIAATIPTVLIGRRMSLIG